MENAAVGGNQVTGLEKHYVAGHYVGGGYLDGFGVADDFVPPSIGTRARAPAS